MSSGINRKNRIREAMEILLKAFENNPGKVALAVFKGKQKTIRCLEPFKPTDNTHEQHFWMLRDSGSRRGREGRLRRGAKAF